MNGGTSNVECGDFILLRSRKVLTVARDITPSEDDLLYTGVTVCILLCQTSVRVCTVSEGTFRLTVK